MANATGLDATASAKVLEILNMTGATFAAINSSFTQAFSPDTHGAVVSMLRLLLDSPFGLSDNVTVVPQTLIAYHLLRQAQLAASQGPRRATVVNLVRATQFHELQRLEILLREDAKNAEAHKYKQSNAAGTKKQSAKEAAEIDIGRCRLLMKTLLFRHILNRPDVDSVAELLAIPRSALEAEADSWATQANLKASLVEAMAELKVAAESESAVSMGSMASRTAVFQVDEQDCSMLPASVSFRPTWARPPPTTLPVAGNELRFLCAPSISSSLLLDHTPHTADWKTATTLLPTAKTQKLTPTQHQQLVQAASKCAGHYNMTIPAFLDVSEHNPQTASSLLQTVPQPELYIDALIALPTAAGCLRSEVLLAAAPIVQPHQVSAYVKNMTVHIRGQPKDKQAELVSNLAVTLHQLAKKNPLSKADADFVAPLFQEHSSVADVSSLWPSTNKA